MGSRIFLLLDSRPSCAIWLTGFQEADLERVLHPICLMARTVKQERTGQYQRRIPAQYAYFASSLFHWFPDLNRKKSIWFVYQIITILFAVLERRRRPNPPGMSKSTRSDTWQTRAWPSDQTWRRQVEFNLITNEQSRRKLKRRVISSANNNKGSDCK